MSQVSSVNYDSSHILLPSNNNNMQYDTTNNNLPSFRISLWNANGLGTTVIHDVLSHCMSSDVLFITETWLLHPSRLPTNWDQYHLYGVPVRSTKRGSMGVSCLVSPDCTLSVSQLPSPNNYTLVMKIGALHIVCLYLPPSLSTTAVDGLLSSLPIHYPNTVLCGDFNARIGDLTGDSTTNSRGRLLQQWLDTHQLAILNSSLSFGQPTWAGVRNHQATTSIIDLFITDLTLSSPFIAIDSDLSLSSDHNLMHLTFVYDFDPVLPSDSSPSGIAHPRRTWNLSRLQEVGPYKLYVNKFTSKIAPLLSVVSDLLHHPPVSRPDIDALCHQLNDVIYKSLDESLGSARPRPAHWKKYWSSALQEAAELRDKLYSRWRRASGIDKADAYFFFQRAQKSFRTAVLLAKRQSWRAFCDQLDRDCAKALSTVKHLKKRHQSSSTFMHPDGPAAAVTTMAQHLSSVYNGSLLPDSRPVTPLSPLVPLPISLGHLPVLPGHPLVSPPSPGSSSSSQDSSFLSQFVSLDIRAEIYRLPNRKAPGSDHIKAEALKPISFPLSDFLSLFYTLCFQWCYVPSLWRHAQVFPIFKKGDPSSPSNYRPISLTSVFRKLLECCIALPLYDSSPPLDVAQGGFRPSRSPLDQALCLHELMVLYFRQHHHYPVVAFLDIKSAYDTVDRNVIWSALSQSGASPSFLSFLMHLFDDVSISVLISNHSSAPFSPATGVLQGSVLSPHLYSIYVNSLPGLLRSISGSSTPSVLVPQSLLVNSSLGSTGVNTPINSLLFADDVAIFGSKDEVSGMLSLCEQHSLQLGYRWSPSKCAVLNHPSATSSTSSGLSLSLYDEVLPQVDSFKYLGVPFLRRGLDAAALISLRTPDTLKSMALLNLSGVNRDGFSLQLCSRLYSTFIRPKFEYGLAISNLRAPDVKALEKLQDRCLRTLVGGHSSSSTTVLKHITALPNMQFRSNSLAARFALRLSWLPSDALLTLLNAAYPDLSRTNFLCENPLYLALPDPPPVTNIQLKMFFCGQYQIAFDAFLSSTTQTLITHCRPKISVDPILLVPATRQERSLLVRWRLGWLPGTPKDCPCNEDRTSRHHFFLCRAIPSELWSSLPAATDHSPIDLALNSLPLHPDDATCPPWWPTLLTLLWHIQCLCRPDHFFPEMDHPGSLWLSPSSDSSESLS